MDNGCWVEKWSALHTYLKRLQEEGNVFTFYKVCESYRIRWLFSFTLTSSLRLTIMVFSSLLSSYITRQWMSSKHMAGQYAQPISVISSTIILKDLTQQVVVVQFCVANNDIAFFFLSTCAPLSIGLFQMGSGKLLAVWTAIFANKSESNDLWAECADALHQAGIENLYKGVVHFRDRHTGCGVFETKMNIGLGMYCVPHLLRNIQQHKV